MATIDEIVFLHFNDVYHINKPVNIAKFLTQLRAWRRRYADKDPCTIFSGDVFSPSLEASLLRGEHMTPLLNEIGIDVACYGNHDFDFGEEKLRELAEQTQFPWLLSNVLRTSNGTIPSLLNAQGDLREDLLLAGAKMCHTQMLQGYKIGFFGLAGTDWPSNCRELPECSILSPVESARAVARHLRAVEKCDFVVAITHMRLVEDIKVSEALGDSRDESRVDLVLGGHDHHLLRRYKGEDESNDPTIIDANKPNSRAIVTGTGMVEEAEGPIRIIKSGTDWKNLSLVRLQVSRSSSNDAILHKVLLSQVANMQSVIQSSPDVDLSLARIQSCLEGVTEHVSALDSQPLLHSAVPLEGTGSIVRSRETNLCNLLADMVRAYYDVDIALINAGGIRCDRQYPRTLHTGHPLTVRDVIDIVPFNNALVVKRVPSAALLNALENSVSDAHTDGRFLQYSGLQIVANWSNPEGSRVLEAQFHPPSAPSMPSPQPIRVTRELDRSFTVAMAAFIADGFDGYTSLKDCETLVGEEGAMTDTELLLRSLKYKPNDGTKIQDDTEEEKERLERARIAVLKSVDGPSGLPVVSPNVEGRIRFVDGQE